MIVSYKFLRNYYKPASIQQLMWDKVPYDDKSVDLIEFPLLRRQSWIVQSESISFSVLLKLFTLFVIRKISSHRQKGMNKLLRKTTLLLQRFFQ